MVLLALLVINARPQILNACRALESGNKVNGIAEISIESPLDSDRYYAELFPNSGPAWKIEFIPQGWRPVRGQIKVEMIFIAGVDWPVLIIGPKGIFYPRDKAFPI